MAKAKAKTKAKVKAKPRGAMHAANDRLSSAVTQAANKYGISREAAMNKVMAARRPKKKSPKKK